MGRESHLRRVNALKQKYNVSKIWSWSRYNSYKTDPYGYLLKYILKERETKESIYGVSGGVCHDIIERFYKNELKYEDMIEEYETKLLEMNLSELKYNRSNSDANEKIADKYEDNIRLFFKNHIPIVSKVLTEQTAVIKVGKSIFQGYIDFIHKDELGNFIITDWKTSTRYTGKKIDKEKGQLVLYAESLIQAGIPVDKIKIRWNFLKYCEIEYDLKGIDKETKLNKTKTTIGLRNEWISKIKTNLSMWLKEAGYDELEIEDMIMTAIENNNLDNIPIEISNRYKVRDCYVYIPLNQEVIDELKDDMIQTLAEILRNELEYNKLIQNNEKEKAEKLFWTEIDQSNEFYFYNLCGYSVNQHKPFKEYLDNARMFVNDEYKDNTDGLSEVCSDNTLDDFDSWLSELD